MKVLQIIDRLHVGGAERVFVDLSNLLYEKNVDVTTLVFKNEGALLKNLHTKIPKLKFTRKKKYSFFEWYRLSKTLKEYDILHVHMRHNYMYIRLICRVFGVKSKVILHDHISINTKPNLLFFNYLKPKYYISVSSSLQQWAITTVGITPKNTFLLENCIKKEQVTSINSEKKGIVVVGNIKPVKNQLFVIKLVPYLKKEVTFIGKILDKDYYDQLNRTAKKLGVSDQVSFKHDINNVQPELQKYELGLMPSTVESGPLVLIEYLAQSLPFVSYRTGQVSHLVSEELPNFFISNFTIEDWCTKISILPQNNVDLKTIYTTFFSPEKYVQTCKSIYNQIISY